STRSEDRTALTPPSCSAAVLLMRKLDPDDRRPGCSVRREIDPAAAALPPDRTRKPRRSRPSPVTARPAPGRLARQGRTDHIRLPVAAADSGFSGQIAGSTGLLTTEPDTAVEVTGQGCGPHANVRVTIIASHATGKA